jgi:zinc protease
MKRVVLALFLVSCSSHKTALKSGDFVPPVFQPTTQVKLGGLERSTLGNGLEMILVPRKSVPSVVVTLSIKVGQSADPVDKSGLASFVAEMLQRGTKTRSAEQIAEAVDFAGASLGALSADDATHIVCQARSKDLQLCLDLMADIVQNPTFPEEEIAHVRRQVEGTIESTKDSPSTLASQHASNLFYGDNDVRGRPISHKSLSKIDRAQLVEFHKRWFAPNNAILAVSGDFDDSLVKRAFVSWNKREVPKQGSFASPGVGPMKVRVVDKPDATQSTIAIVGPGIAHAAADFYAVQLMNYSLGGGGFSSRLMKVVRSEGGKTYGANSGFEAGRDAGPFTASTFTRNAETGATIGLVMGEIEKMRASGPTQEELDAGKGKVIGGFGLSLETGSDLAHKLVSGVIDGLGNDYLEKYPQRMMNVTLADAKKAAADHLFPTTLVVVGNAKEITPQLEKLGYQVSDVVPFTAPVSATER